MRFSFLREREVEEEDEEKVHLQDLATQTGERCSYDEEHLHYGEEIVHLTISFAFHNGSEVVITPIVDDDTGDYTFEPHFFEFSCWENFVEEIEEMVEDAPPVRHEESLLHCDYCGSGICEWETFGSGYLGEIHLSPRQPNGRPEHAFVVNDPDPFTVCLGCLVLANEHVIELWEPEDLNHRGECQECTHARCWRWKGCTCICHEPEPPKEPTISETYVDTWKRIFG